MRPDSRRNFRGRKVGRRASEGKRKMLPARKQAYETVCNRLSKVNKNAMQIIEDRRNQTRDVEVCRKYEDARERGRWW